MEVAGFVAFTVWWVWFCNPLPSDEEMIAYFQANRTQFEELVELFRTYRPDQETCWLGMTYQKSKCGISALGLDTLRRSSAIGCPIHILSRPASVCWSSSKVTGSVRSRFGAIAR